MKKITFIAFMSFFIALMSVTCSFADVEKADTIIQKAHMAVYNAGKDGLYDVEMVILDDHVNEQLWNLRILRVNPGVSNDQLLYVDYDKPSFMSKVACMVWKNFERGDNRWVYLPDLDKDQLLEANNTSLSFAGTDYAYEVLSGVRAGADEHEIIDNGTSGYYWIKSTPKDSSKVEFAYYYVWIKKENFLPVKMEFFDKNDLLVRLVDILEIKELQGYPTITKFLVKDLIRGGESIVRFKNVNFDIGVDQSALSQKFLRGPKPHWVKL